MIKKLSFCLVALLFLIPTFSFAFSFSPPGDSTVRTALIRATTHSLIQLLYVSGQTHKDSCCLAKKDLVGIWQRDEKRVGNGLGENFRFYKDGSFQIQLSNEGEDARGIISLEGKYRLAANNKLYLTILSRTVLEGGKIVTIDQGENVSIFGIEGATVRQIKEVNPKELADPLDIIIKAPDNILIGSENYFKLSKEGLRSINIEPVEGSL